MRNCPDGHSHQTTTPPLTTIDLISGVILVSPRSACWRCLPGTEPPPHCDAIIYNSQASLPPSLPRPQQQQHIGSRGGEIQPCKDSPIFSQLHNLKQHYFTRSTYRSSLQPRFLLYQFLASEIFLPQKHYYKL